MALNSLYCADVPLSNYSLNHAAEDDRMFSNVSVKLCSAFLLRNGRDFILDLG